jgi:iron uptake system component EfeO
MARRSVAALVTAGVAVAVAGCGGTGPSGGGRTSVTAVPAGPITVRAADTSCVVSVVHAPAGTIRFTVTNRGSRVTGFALSGRDDGILGAVEDIGPGLSRQLVVEVPDGGIYTTACRPGLVGDGIRAPFVVTGAATRPTDIDAVLAEAVAGYRRYAGSQTDVLAAGSREFAGAVKAGDVDRARALFPVAHTPYERIEPVAESFRDLDARLDDRVDTARDPGVAWTGFHRLEKDLWVDGLQPDSGRIADQLVTDVEDLRTRTATMELSATDLATGAKDLLDDVVTRKITGEEDRYSHTDLGDLEANVEGAHTAVAALRPAVDQKDRTLGPVLDERFAAVEALLERYRSGDGFRSYTELTPDDIKAMTDAVDALSEPVSQVAGVVTS